ncbi:Coenzyme F420 hydrogenase/dehydrogenase, beta subunit C-terminal domain [Oceanicella actignis]|uniref:Coenzyme F420 hydrogenase subunit beta n=1 Tax=Oceanicella actignis TaxID=1189325 RepID=A0A1M7TE51_9RHOB|nr:Coenzyme F420 hydrogenase/dehydrogenase, beta subunit C-terminal domain [Oceanicella actignis]SET62945.1 coenzyme F420 hydrogenase subunit beta [Oceanicella actignis]SHN68928.1 coenzyme F420 hydrogenase subunit beta [Oceanicella actignis]
MSFLDRVERGRLCAGCGGCALLSDGALRMERTPPGFLRPVPQGPLSREAEARIAAICPALGQSVAAEGRPDDVLWGPSLAMHEAWAQDEELRFTGSSGGALSAVLVHLLESGKVDAVVQTAADPADPVANRTVISTSRAEVLAAAGSRYAPSAPLAALGPCLEDDRIYAFVGKPCDVAALRALARLDPRVRARFAFMLSFFCAGVPSLSGAQEVLLALGVAPDEVAAFRYRGRGWPGRAAARLRNGEERSMSYHESWGGILSRHVQVRCKICADGTGMAADLAFADAWQTDEKGYPLFEERDGVSLAVARTRAGEALLREAAEAGALSLRPFDRGRLEAMQPGQAGRRKALLARLAGRRLAGRPVPRYRGLHLLAAARRGGVASNLRNLLGSLRRALLADER